MAQTEFTGKSMTFTWNSVALDGVTKVTINESDGPDAEQLETTVYGDTTYTYIDDPLGSKGDDKTTVTVVCQASTASYADSKASKLAFNAAHSGVFEANTTVANGNVYTNTTLQLTQRVTEIPFDAVATCTLTFECNDLGTWTAPA